MVCRFTWLEQQRERFWSTKRIETMQIYFKQIRVRVWKLAIPLGRTYKIYIKWLKFLTHVAYEKRQKFPRWQINRSRNSTRFNEKSLFAFMLNPQHIREIGWKLFLTTVKTTIITKRYNAFLNETLARNYN